ncbi:MAG TPA: dihydrofolate reductase family protein [Anaerolineales bacterium]
MTGEIIDPLKTLLAAEQGERVPLPEELMRIYGEFRLPLRAGRPYLLANFVETLDGVVSLAEPGHSGAGEISGHSAQDRFVMGILRSVADVVVAGASELRGPPGHVWSPGFIFPSLGPAYRDLRLRLGKAGPPLNLILSASGEIDPGLPLFQSGEVPVLLLTTPAGRERWQARLREASLPQPPSVELSISPHPGRISAQNILDLIDRHYPSGIILLEGGPHLLGDFLAGGLLDELFITLSPQVAGRDEENRRPGLVSGQRFAPDRPVWGSLAEVKRGNSYLFLRYQFSRNE